MKIITHLISITALVILFHSNNVAAENNISFENNKTQEHNGKYVRERFLKLMKQPFVAKKHPQQKKILIIGDSHAQDFLNAIVENNYLHNSQIRTRYIPTRCQIYLGNNTHKKWLSNDKQLCNKSDNLELAKTQIKNADVIIFAALWRKWAAQALPETLKKLKLRNDQRLFVIGRRSFRKVNKEEIKSLKDHELKVFRNSVDENQIEINNIMRNTLDKNIFINVHLIMCGASSTCPAFTKDLKLISFDGGHLSQDGALFLGNELFQKSQLRSLLDR